LVLDVGRSPVGLVLEDQRADALAGPEAASLLGTHWNCGDLAALTRTAAAAGLHVVDSRTRTGTARFDSSDPFVATEVEAAPMVERIDASTCRRIKDDAGAALTRCTTDAGRFEIPLLGHVIAARPARS
jgi:hypothetical protein